MWVHDLELGGELSKLGAWVEPNHARKASFKKSAFLRLERGRELSKHGGAWWPWSEANEAQGPCLACLETLAPMVEARGECELENSSLEAFP